jgi:hypothetical protein
MNKRDKRDKRTIVRLYKFEKLPNIRGNGQEYKVTNNLTGEVVYERTRDASGKIREKGNELYYADTKTRLLDENSEDEGEEQLKSSSSSASVVSVATVKKTLIREFSAHQKHDILNEVLYGQHLNKDGKTIDVAQRSKYGNVGLFYASICAVLNDGVSYPSFKNKKAVQATVKSFVDDEVTAHQAKLVSRFGANFIQHESFMVYSCESGTDEEEELGDDFYTRQVLMFLDALVFADVSEDKEESLDEGPRHTQAQETELQEKNIDGKQRKRPRVEKVKEKPINHVAQLQEQHHGLTSLINSIVAMTSEGPRPAAAESVDPGVLAIKNTLTALPAPPGLPAVCQKLAEGLAGYGFCTLQELLAIRDTKYDSASAILRDLHWSVLQIERVLGEPPQ